MKQFNNRISLRSIVKIFGVAVLTAIVLLLTSKKSILQTFDPQSQLEPTVFTYESIDLAGAIRAFHSSNVIFLDARPDFLFGLGHIENAVNVPISFIATMPPILVAKLNEASKVIVYCDGSWCGLAGHEVDLLAAKGVHNAIVYSGGWAEWDSCKLPRIPPSSL